MEKFQLTLGKVMALNEAISTIGSDSNLLDFDLALDIRKIRKGIEDDVKAFQEESDKVLKKVVDEIKNDKGEYHIALANKMINEKLGKQLEYVVEFECNPIDINRLLKNQKGKVGVNEKNIDAMLESGVFFDPSEKKKVEEKPKKTTSKKS